MNIFKQLLSVLLVSITVQCVAGEKIDQSLPTNEVNNVNIENLRGQVTIVGWDQQQVSVQGQLDDKTEKFIFEQHGSQINIKVVMPHHFNNGWNDKGSVLTIHMPFNVRMSFSGVSSDVNIDNLSKGVEVKTVSGEIIGSRLTKHVELRTVSGNIKTSKLSGKIQLVTVSGDIDDNDSAGRLQIKAVSGEIESRSGASEVFVKTVSGEIDLNLTGVDELEVSTVSGNSRAKLQLNDSGLVKLSSISGDLRVKFQQSIAANFRLTANAGGDLVNKLTSDKAVEAKYGPSSKLNFATGDGNGSVRASTVSGSIHVSGG
jgi:DUF4097 and DUF4098 domain-containing protein YvlB